MSTQEQLLVEKLTRISEQQDSARSQVWALSEQLEASQGIGNTIKDSASLAKLKTSLGFELRRLNFSLQILSKQERETRDRLQKHCSNI